MQVGEAQEIPVGSDHRIPMLLCEITDDFVARFALKSEVPHVGTLK